MQIIFGHKKSTITGGRAWWRNQDPRVPQDEPAAYSAGHQAQQLCTQGCSLCDLYKTNVSMICSMAYLIEITHTNLLATSIQNHF